MGEMNRKRILVTDDEADAREFVRAILEDDFEILTAANGMECLEVARREMPDLVLLDVQMPVMGGIDAFVALKKDDRLCGIPVIMLTGVREKTGLGLSKEEMGDCFGEEPDSYLEKPIEPSLLYDAVCQCLGVNEL